MATEQMGQDRLGTRALRGGRILAFGTVIERVARLGRTLVLARVIAPEHFGLMAITLAVIALFQALTEVGVSQAVIQNKRGNTAEFIGVAWWLGLARGVVVAALMVPLAGPIADFYNEPELGQLLLVAPLTVLFTGMVSPRIYALQRDFRFGSVMWTMQGAGLLGTVVTIALGLWLQSVWALLWGAVFEAFARFVISFVLCPVRPGWRWDPQSRRELFRFTRGMAGLSLLTLVLMHAHTFVLGKVVTASELGIYTMAILVAGFPLTLFGKVAQPLMVPILARFQDDMDGMRDQLRSLSRLVWLFGLPLAAVLACVAPQLLATVYGRAEFAQAAPAFSLYAAFTVTYMASMVSFSVYLAIAKPELQRRFTLVRAGVVAVLLYPLSVLLGGTGAALTLLVAMVVAFGFQLFNLRRVVGLRVLSYLGTLLPGLVAAAAVSALCLTIVWAFPFAQWVDVVACAAVGALCWGLLLLRERRTLRALRQRSGPTTPTTPRPADLGTE